MSTKTTNFEFIKPELTDTADITQYNENWDKVDTKFKEIATEFEGVSKNVTPESIGAATADHTHTPASIGAASIGSDGKIPTDQIPSLNYIPTSQKGAKSGVASLGSDGKVPTAQLPSMNYIPTSEKGSNSGVATLGSDGKVPTTQLPSMDYVPNSQKGSAGGVATLGSDGKVPSTQLPEIEVPPAWTYGTTDLEAGVTPLETGKLHFVYE